MIKTTAYNNTVIKVSEGKMARKTFRNCRFQKLPWQYNITTKDNSMFYALGRDNTC